MYSCKLIHSIGLRNLLSFGSERVDVELLPLNIIIGTNGSGKSNFIDSLSLLKSAPKDLSAGIRSGGGIHEWLWRGNTRENIALIEAIIDNPRLDIPLKYTLSFTESSQRIELVDERIENSMAQPGKDRPYFYYKFEHGHPIISHREKEGETRLQRESLDFEQSILSQRKDPDNYPVITYISEVFSKIRIYRNWSFGRNTPARLPQPADLPNTLLEANFENLGLVLNRLGKEAHTKKKLLESLNALYEGIDDYGVSIEGGTVQIFFHEGKYTIPATRLSDGTLRYLCLLAILCNPNPPPLVCIEEPELGLHPDVIPTIAKLLVEASEKTQLVVTTHSDILVDEFTENPENILVCEKDEQGSTLKRLKQEELKEWLDEYTMLGDSWLSGAIGGKRW